MPDEIKLSQYTVPLDVADIVTALVKMGPEERADVLRRLDNEAKRPTIRKHVYHETQPYYQVVRQNDKPMLCEVLGPKDYGSQLSVGFGTPGEPIWYASPVKAISEEIGRRGIYCKDDAERAETLARLWSLLVLNTE